MKKILLVPSILLITSLLYAQAIPTSKFAWDQSAPDLTTVQAYTYKHYDDNSATGVAFVGVTCTGTASPFTCVVNIPAYTPGNHSITLSASNVAGESVKSAPFAFVFVVTPGSPANIRIQQ